MKTVTLEALSRSKFRGSFRLKGKDLEYASAKGKDILEKHAFDFIKKRLAPENPPNDGKQTPFRGHPVFVAQHATATCCRSCLLKWHKIPKGRALNESEIKNIVHLILNWIEKELRSN